MEIAESPSEISHAKNDDVTQILSTCVVVRCSIASRHCIIHRIKRFIRSKFCDDDDSDNGDGGGEDSHGVSNSLYYL